MTTTNDEFVAATFALTESVRGAIIDPADQINALIPLCGFAPSVTQGGSPVSNSVAVNTLATAALCRRAALTSLSYACAAYRPTSSTEVLTIIARISPLYDAEITYAADAGDLATYSSLRALRSAVLQDLQTRGSQLPELITFSFNATQPSLVLAYRLYADATRSDDLVRRANPPNPLFCPLSFVALSA
jgi:prophage DNA circulation protein